MMEDPDVLCRHCGKKGCIKYYYLGLSDKIRTWFSDFSMCKKMLAHWVNKENWIRGVGHNLDLLKEVWDGSRFNELAWFWDPDLKWMLPHKCSLCGNVVSADQIKASAKCNEVHSAQCEECGEMQEVRPVFVSGEPRNIALIVDWDGWQQFGSPGRHSCGK